MRWDTDSRAGCGLTLSPLRILGATLMDGGGGTWFYARRVHVSMSTSRSPTRRMPLRQNICQFKAKWWDTEGWDGQGKVEKESRRRKQVAPNKSRICHRQGTEKGAGSASVIEGGLDEDLSGADRAPEVGARSTAIELKEPRRNVGTPDPSGKVYSRKKKCCFASTVKKRKWRTEETRNKNVNFPEQGGTCRVTPRTAQSRCEKQWELV